MKQTRKVRKILFLSTVLVLLTMIGYSGHRLWNINRNNAQEAEVHNWLMQYHPLSRPSVSAKPDEETVFGEITVMEAEDLVSAPQVVNQSIVDLQEERPGVIGWLTVPNTKIDYPFAQGVDNDHYLHLDLNGSWSAAGTIFMDFRNSRDLSDFHTIIYGHHMRNGSMFGTLQQFNNQFFFDNNRTGTIFLAHATYKIEFMAFAVVPPNDMEVYNPTIQTEAEQTAFLDHIRNTARYYHDIGVTANDRLVTLSTCNYEFYNARMVLIGRLVEA